MTMTKRLSLYEYEQSQQISAQGYQFYALLGALIRDADTDNTARLKAAWPDIYESMQRRYNAPMGVVPEWDGFTAEEYYARKQQQADEDAEDEDAEDW
jgi:hypothetical protein